MQFSFPRFKCPQPEDKHEQDEVYYPKHPACQSKTIENDGSARVTHRQ